MFRDTGNLNLMSSTVLRSSVIIFKKKTSNNTVLDCLFHKLFDNTIELFPRPLKSHQTNKQYLEYAAGVLQTSR